MEFKPGDEVIYEVTGYAYTVIGPANCSCCVILEAMEVHTILPKHDLKPFNNDDVITLELE